jgi:hypothetical protein
MKEQTAVEWLINELGYKDLVESKYPTLTRILEQAKAMEKEQIIEAYLKNHLQGCWMKNTPEEYAEQYYNETYESKTNI